MQTIKHYLKIKIIWQYLSLFFVLIISGYFYLHNLGADYITLWDEAVHINVVKNLSQDIWPPKLHLTDIGIDFQDWTNNYIWLHKPLLPLYLQTLFYKASPTLLAFRLPNVLFAIFCGVALFILIKKNFGGWIAFCTSSLFLFNPYVYELVKGRQFSGLHDLMFCFFGVLVLGKILNIVEKPIKKNFLWFGLFLGLAYLSKGGLALLFLPALAYGLFFLENKKEAFLNFCYAGLCGFLVVFPEKFLLTILYPAEYYFEQKSQIMHLFKDLEYWGRPFDYYFTVYLKDLTTYFLYLPAIWAIFWGFTVVLKVIKNFFKERKVFNFEEYKISILLVWILTFLFFLSFGITKISNFIFPALPIIFLLMILMIRSDFKSQKPVVLLSVYFSTLIIYLIFRFDILNFKFYFFQIQTFFERASFLSLGLIFTVFILIIFTKFFNRFKKSLYLKYFIYCIIFLFLIVNVKFNIRKDEIIFSDYNLQTQIKNMALDLKEEYKTNDIFLIYFPEFSKPHLYFKYWSGLEAMEIYERQPISALEKLLPKQRNLYILSHKNLSIPNFSIVKKRDWGYLYRQNYEKK